MNKCVIKVDWADLDLFGHVNNVVFFKYIQAARVEFCEKAGLTSLNNTDQLSFMVASSRCEFKRPLYYPGSVEIMTSCVWTRNTSFQLSYSMINNKGELVASGEDVLVVYDHRLKSKMPITEALKQFLIPG